VHFIFKNKLAVSSCCRTFILSTTPLQPTVASTANRPVLSTAEQIMTDPEEKKRLLENEVPPSTAVPLASYE
jgi:hypothetical protein